MAWNVRNNCTQDLRDSPDARNEYTMMQFFYCATMSTFAFVVALVALIALAPAATTPSTPPSTSGSYTRGLSRPPECCNTWNGSVSSHRHEHWKIEHRSTITGGKGAACHPGSIADPRCV